MAGRLTLINSVLPAIPLYWTSVLKLPTAIVHKINKICRKILWKDNQLGGKVKTLARWSSVCWPKKLGGLGILNLSLMNQSLQLK